MAKAMTAEEIDKVIDETIKKVMNEAAYELAFEIESAYESAIDAFYRSYTPRFYDRNYYTYTGSDSYDNYSKHIQITDKYFITGITVSSEHVQGTYKDPTDYVFERSYYSGIHGTIATGGIMVVPPERLMQMSFEGIIENLDYYFSKYF